MKFDDLIQRLNEGTSPLRRLYHYTNLYKASKIVSENKFELTYGKGADALANPNYKRNFFLSTSSIARGRYGTGSEGKYYEKNFHCVIELDASKVSDNYKIVPVNYWYHPSFETKDVLRMDETEERIVSRDHKIPNAKKYIIAIHVYVPPLDEIDKERHKMTNDKINIIAQSGVEYYVYDNINDFQLLRREKAHKLEDTHQYELRNMEELRKSTLEQEDRFVETINWLLDPNAEIDEKLKSRLERNWNWQELHSTINADIHNEMRSMRPKTQSALHKLSEYQRKSKKSLEDIAKDAFYRNRERY